MKPERRSWKIHAVFECQECDWENGLWTDADKLARKHAQETGHHVRGENGFCVVYNEPD